MSQYLNGIPVDDSITLCECEQLDGFAVTQAPRLRMSNAEWLEMETIISFAIAELQQKGSIYLAQQMREVSAKLHSARAGI